MKYTPPSLPLALSLFLGLGAAMPLSYLASPAPVVSAAVQHVSADGVYVMGDGIEESQHVAKIRARQDAMRMASEQAGVYVESYTKTVNSVLTEDEVRTLASTVLNVTNETYAFDDMGGQGMKIVCHIEADVDTVKIDEALKARRENAQKWEELQDQDKALREQVAKLQQENEALKAAYANAQTEQEKQKIEAEAKKNQEAVTAVDWYERGRAAFIANRSEEACKDFEEALRLDPNYAPAHNGRGVIYEDLKQYEKAISEYTEAIRLDPTLIKAYKNRGITYVAMKQYEKAVQDYTGAIRLDSKDAVAYSLRGDAYDELGQYERAVQDYTEAIRLKPDEMSLARLNRGKAYCDLGQYENGVRDCTEVIRLTPDFPVAYSLRGSAYYALGQYEKAIEDCTEAIRLDPAYADAYYNRGNAYYGLKQYEKAIEDYTEAIRLDPTQAFVYDNRGNAYYDKAEYRKALADHMEAIRLEPTARAYYDRGWDYFKLGDYANAYRDAKQANNLQVGKADDLLNALRKHGY